LCSSHEYSSDCVCVAVLRPGQLGLQGLLTCLSAVVRFSGQDAQLHMNYHWKTSSSVHVPSAFLVKDGREADDMVWRTVHETLHAVVSIR